MSTEKELGSTNMPAVLRPGLEAPLQILQPKDTIASEDIDATAPIEPATASPADPPVVPSSTTRSNFRTLTILVALYLTVFIAALDQTIVATTVPTIATSLHSARGYTWIGGAYLIANAAAGPIWAKLSDIWGRKPLLLIAVAWFFGASIVCAKATSMQMLIAGRALQGIAGGGCWGLVIVTISDLFSMRRRALWLGILEVMWAIAGGTGPILGGVFAEKIGWRWIFWINLPVCGSSFIILLLFLDVHNPQTRIWDGIKAIDWAGSLSILGVTLMLLLSLDFGGETFPWNSPKVICLLVFGSVSILIFLLSEKKLARYPLMPLKLFKNRSNVAALLVTLAHGIVYIAGEYYMPLYLQSTHGANPIRSGLLILPFIICEALAGFIGGIIIHQLHAHRELIIGGTALMALGTGLYINLGATTSIAKLIIYEITCGLGCGVLFNAPVIAIQAFTAQEHVATATSTQAFVRNMATSIGVVIGGIIFQNSMSERAGNSRQAHLSSDLLSKLSGANAAANVGVVNTIEDPAQVLIVKEAFAWSIRNMWIFYTCVAVLGVVASVFVKKARLSEDHIETRTGLLSQEKDSGADLELSTRRVVVAGEA